ncbi:glycoside hydrolase family 5 protein [Tilletiaria anomala UBC 951]|uniref:Glycoside hydrolase family 5 protein n=1 Tax=Tilletiaria anomala (strain ATCC 24038 / CBS 436.72 / UBC 951) TaxID=1037660 RepID=A0A066WNJ9_TILAU|nr:glycoside hydrolase family 5 protein [Tilletiaria anomala UBC 951]KDN52579.1 glycoside hydrolase family 5 protein [Tilletiaria anomala UBC 951]
MRSPPPTGAVDFSVNAIGADIRIDGRRFVDSIGRTLILHGLNVSSMSKLPTTPNGLSHLPEGFVSDDRTVTFIGRPFPLEEAPLRLRQLRAWGYPLIRLMVTWESISHKGPRIEDIDREYVEYLRQLMQLIGDHGMKAFICAHQDVWSRYTGGSGAPGWTLDAVGLNRFNFKDCGAAYIHSLDNSSSPKEPSGPFLWPSGYQKLAAGTMATLFWGGDVFAPNTKCQLPEEEIAGGQFKDPTTRSVQQFLQNAYIEAYGYLADVVGNMEGCLGFDLMNEPHRGFINLHSFHKWDYQTDLHIGHYPSLLQSLALGSGHATDVPFYVKSWPWPTYKSHTSHIDPKGKTVWKKTDESKGDCIWRSHGVWDWDEKNKKPVVLWENYFSSDNRPGKGGRPVEWYRDFYAPFCKKFSERLLRKCPGKLILVEQIPNEFMPVWPDADVLSNKKDRAELEEAARRQNYAVKGLIDTERPKNFVYAPHFYDLNVLFGKVWRSFSVDVQGLSRGMFFMKALYWGEQGARQNYLHQLTTQAKWGRVSMGEVPMLVGEIGLPFDINDAHAYRTGDYRKHAELVDGMLSALEKNWQSFTWWNFNPDCIFEYGDGWNKEDFSVIALDLPSRDRANVKGDHDELYRGGRVLEALIRPYAAKVAGLPVSTHWDRHNWEFTLAWSNSSTVPLDKADKLSRMTEIFWPTYLFEGERLEVQLSDGTWRIDENVQTLYVEHADESIGRVHKLRVRVPARARRVPKSMQIGEQDRLVLGAVAFLFVALLVGFDGAVTRALLARA